jgi:hypothetical protein
MNALLLPWLAAAALALVALAWRQRALARALA